MKKYITILGLLLAGSLLANAEVKTTFNKDLSSITATNTTLNVVGAGATTAIVASLKNTTTQGDAYLKNDGEAGSTSTFFSPTSGVGAPWIAKFTYTFKTPITITGITLNVGVFNDVGNWETGNFEFDFTVMLEKTVSKKETVYADGTNKPIAIHFDFSEPITLTPVVGHGTITKSLDITVKQNTSNTNLGLHSIVFNTQAVPEPSAFGLLAGIGALALVASRRRRK